MRRQDKTAPYRFPAYRPTLSRLVYEGVGITLLFAVFVVGLCILCPPDLQPKVSYTRALMPISQER